MSGYMADILVCEYFCVCVCYVVAIAGDTSKHNILESAQGDLEVGAGDVLHLPDLSWPKTVEGTCWHRMQHWKELPSWFTLRVSFCLC